MRSFLIACACLSLAACGHKDSKPAAQAEDLGAPQVATSIDELDLPVDKSDQITSIDAATGDAGGMPKDGGAVIQAPRAAPAEPKAAAPVAPDTAPPSTAPIVPAAPPAGNVATPTAQ